MGGCPESHHPCRIMVGFRKLHPDRIHQFKGYGIGYTNDWSTIYGLMGQYVQ
jgi:hypothetical protein